MQAIITKILPTTEHKPRRCKATAQGGSVTISTDAYEDYHREAALALCRKLGWEGSLVMGTLPNEDNVWVFIESQRHIVFAHGRSKEAKAS